MNCTICGQESMPGAKLCADCRAARKRAFAATVTQPLLEAAGARRSRGAVRLLKPSQSMAATARRAARKAKAEAGSPLVDTPSPRRGLLPAILIGVVLLLGAGAYGAHRMKAADVPEAKTESEGQQAPGKQLAPLAPAPMMVAPALVPTPASAAASSDVTSPTLTGQPREPLPTPVKKQPARPRAIPAQPVIALPAADAPPAIVVAAPAPPPPPAPKPVVRVDPWQQFNEGMSGCAREDWGGRFRCEQRLRVRYCEGQWGVAPQCPIGPNTDHGQ